MGYIKDRQGSFLHKPHQNKERAFVQALEEAGYTKTLHANARLRFAILDHDVGPNGIGHLPKLKTLQRMRVPVFMIPHAARPTAFWDGMYPVWPHTVCTFVIAEGHVEVMRRYGYQLPLEVCGWPFCELKPFHKVEKVRKILFGPIHPNTNGWLCDEDLGINRGAFERLVEYSRETGAELTVRYIRKLKDNGLPEVEGVNYIQAVPDGSTKEIDEADLVVSHQTFAYLAVARGRPTLMMGEDVPPRTGNAPENFRYAANWDKYAELVQFPLDILKGDPAEMIERATRSDADIAKWRADMIGKPFNGPEFVRKLESQLPRRSERIVGQKAERQKVARQKAERQKAERQKVARVPKSPRAVKPVVTRKPVKDLKVLIYCPMFPTEPRIRPATLRSILAQDWYAPHEVVFGKNDTVIPEARGEKLADIARKYNQARELVLKGGYDALLTVEADLILPTNALTRLAEVDADVAYGLYVSRHNNNWYLYTSGPERGRQAGRDKEFRRAVWGKVVESVGIGTGCTLIHRRVLETLSFEAAPGVAHDWNFSKACQAHGFRQAHDCGVVCGHIHAGEILWPDPDLNIRKEKMLEPSR
jgi:hypothetical protein